MNIGRKKITEEDFNTYWTTIEREFLKIHTGSLCNAVLVYNTVYDLCTSINKRYDELLYWKIGDFLYSLAKESRKLIFEAPDWVQEYVKQFNMYRLTNDTISVLSEFLNDTLQISGNGRNIHEFGYLLWERCVLQQTVKHKGTTLGSELIQRTDDSLETKMYIKDALSSLKSIIPDTQDPLAYYKLSYEIEALRVLEMHYEEESHRKARNIVTYIKYIKESFAKERRRREYIFLEESYEEIEKCLERVLVFEQRHFIEDELFLLISTNLENVRDMYEVLVDVSPSSVEILKRVLVGYISIKLEENENLNGIADINLFFNKVHSIFINIKNIVESAFKGNATLKETMHSHLTYHFNSFTKPCFGERLADFTNLIIKNEISFTKFGNIFNLLENREIFAKFYLIHLSKRLLTYNCDYKKENDLLLRLKDGCMPDFYRKAVKMFKDINWSVSFNNMLYDKHRMDGWFFVSVLTYCVWPIPEEEKHTLILPPNLKKMVSLFNSQYNALYKKKRRLQWIWTMGYVEVSIQTDQEYTLRVNLHQYIILELFNSHHSVCLSDIKDKTGIKEYKEIVDSLVSFNLLKMENSVLFFNFNFKNEKRKLKLKSIFETNVCKQKMIVAADPLFYYQCVVARIMKRMKDVEVDRLLEVVKDEHVKVFEYDEDKFKESINVLIERGIIEEYKGEYKYVP